MKSILAFILFFTTQTFASDFYTFKTVLEPQAPSDCRAHIRDVICLVNPMIPVQDPNLRECIAGGEKYAEIFETIHDQTPPVLQKMFCSLKRLFIEIEFEGTAYAGTVENAKGQVEGAVMGIRKSVLDEQLKLQHWSSWKEQLSFNGILDSYTLTPGLPVIETRSDSMANDFIYFVIAHEFAHIFDFGNNINRDCAENPITKEFECNFTPESWSAFSWVDFENVLSGNDFATRLGLCFYWCEGKGLSADLIVPTYQGLISSNFISLYAATNPFDDFADNLAYYLLDKELRSSYVITTASGERFDMMAHLRSEKLAPKVKFIENFLARKDLVYP